MSPSTLFRRLRPRAPIRLPIAAFVVALILAACTHGTPVGASQKTPLPSASSPTDAAQLLVTALAETKYPSAEVYLAPALVPSMETTIKPEWEALATHYGKFMSLGAITATQSGSNTTVTVVATFAGNSATLTITVDSGLKVTSVTIPKPNPNETPPPKPTPAAT